MKKTYSMIFTVMLVSVLFGGCTNNPPVFDSQNDITAISREEGSGTRTAFTELFDIVAKDSNGNIKDMTTKESDIVSKTDVVLTNIASNPYAIGYISMGSMNDSVKALSIDGVDANIENVRNGSYKIFRPFLLATKNNTTNITKDFISFILSTEGQAIVSKTLTPAVSETSSYKASNLEGRVVISGSSSVYPVMENLKEVYCKMNPKALIEIQTSDSTTGLKLATDGTSDIGMASRELKPSEKSSLLRIDIGFDGIAVIVSKNNPLDGLESQQVKNIFTGQITKWSQIFIE